MLFSSILNVLKVHSGRWLNWLMAWSFKKRNGRQHFFFFFTASCNVCLVKKNFFPSFSSLFRKTLLVCLFDAHNKRSGDFSLFSPRYFGIMETLHHSLGSSHLPWTVNEGLARVRFHLLCYLEPKSSCCCCCCFVFFKVQNFTQNSTCHIILPS